MTMDQFMVTVRSSDLFTSVRCTSRKSMRTAEYCSFSFFNQHIVEARQNPGTPVIEMDGIDVARVVFREDEDKFYFRIYNLHASMNGTVTGGKIREFSVGKDLVLDALEDQGTSCREYKTLAFNDIKRGRIIVNESAMEVIRRVDKDFGETVRRDLAKSIERLRCNDVNNTCHVYKDGKYDLFFEIKDKYNNLVYNGGLIMHEKSNKIGQKVKYYQSHT